MRKLAQPILIICVLLVTAGPLLAQGTATSPSTVHVLASDGNIYVGEMSKSFSSVDLLGDYTDISIGLPKGTPYVLDASANYAGIGYPKMMTVTYEKEQMTSHEVKGYAGSNNGSLIKARLRYGALKIREE